ncbi:MAG: PAS domain-containing protein [Microcoleus sp. SU_5_6]|nr:PAS domain-containing protein [Microcoleus sp. SU_5_6]
MANSMYGMPDRKLLEIFLENTPTAVAVLDSQMRYIAASKRWLSDFGLVDTELEGRSHWDVFRAFAIAANKFIMTV